MFPENLRRRATYLKAWAVAHHLDHVFYAALFAIVLDVALRLANIFSPVLPYKIYLMAFNFYSGVDFRKSNETLLNDLKRSFEAVKVGEAGVELELVSIDNDPAKGQDKKRQTLAIEKATVLKNDPSTLMVVTQLESESLRSILPLFLELANPPIPVIPTRETDDLWSDCRKPPSHNWCSHEFVPLLQLPPRNTEEAESAVRFAVQRRRPTNCLVVRSDGSESNKDYVDDLVAEFVGNVEKYYRNPDPTTVVDPSTVRDLSKLDERHPLPRGVNCVLYAGDLRGARTLLNLTAKANPAPLVILSDDSVLPVIHGEEIRSGNTNPRLDSNVYFMDFLDGNDWNSRVNPYVNTAFEIAKQLLNDLDARGGWWFRFRRDFRPPAAQAARKYLADVMKQNEELRVSYDGWIDSRYPDDRPTYTFRKGQSVGTIYHVWQARGPIGAKEIVKMDDVDYWHRPKHPPVKAMPDQ